ncbi:MAG: DUF5681 domain-containing protein [Alphaproteobacteria bacterium]
MKVKNNLNSAGVFLASKSVEHQFKPGQSGNPSGRPRGSFNFKTQISRIASGTAVLSSKHGTIPLSRRVVNVFKAVDDAMRNDLTKLQKLLPNLDIKPKGFNHEN